MLLATHLQADVLSSFGLAPHFPSHVSFLVPKYLLAHVMSWALGTETQRLANGERRSLGIPLGALFGSRTRQKIRGAVRPGRHKPKP